MQHETPSLPLPAAPPANLDQALDWLRLIRSPRVGPATFQRLMAEHGSAAAALAELPAIAASAGAKAYSACPLDRAQAEYAAGRKAGARLICLGSTLYPADLAQVPDAPPVLWVTGRIELLQCPSVALVGARNASSLGTRMAKLLAADLGKAGFAVVSGLARGIDAAAHWASLDTGTIAVLAGGIDQIYPPENRGLAEKIAESGLLMSEQPVGLTPQARHFPRRNRLVSGLARVVVVVEAAARSGSLITARDALDQGREVMAVPGHPLDARASGCNNLLRDGALLVRSAADILAHLAAPVERTAPTVPVPQPTPQPKPAAPPGKSIAGALDLSRRILSLLGPTPVSEDQLIRDLNIPAQTVSRELVSLELEGKLTRKSGGMLALPV